MRAEHPTLAACHADKRLANASCGAGMKLPRWTRIRPVVILLSVCLAASAEADRLELDLSGNWQYQKVSQLTYPPPVTNWQNTTVPGYLSGWQYERAWFRKTFTIPSAMAGTQLKLRFGGAKFASQVWLNGAFVGSYLNGYEPFELDVTAAARVGQINELVVGLSDWTAVFAEPVDFSNLASHEDPRDRARNTLLAPIGGHYSRYGVWQPVTLRSVPAVSVTEVFVMPSVRLGQLTVRLGLRNDGVSDQTVTISNRVLDGAATALSLPTLQAVLPAGAVTNLQVTAPWPNPRLWGPTDPHLYVLETTTTCPAGQDRVHTRFGFREVWCAGDQFYLNGTPLTLLAASCWPPTDVPSNQVIWKVFQDLKAGNNVAIRFHTQPWDERWYDAADEAGVLVVEEFAVWCDSYAYRLSDPQFWSNYAQHVTAAIKRDWNHPSIVLWSLENELLHCGGARAWTNTEAALAALGQMVKALDPTRPITYEADLDPGGVADVIGLHYPYEFPDHVVWPNSAWWMDQYIRRDWAPGGQWRWDRSKPLYIGEFLWVPSSSAADFTILFGDDAYADPRYYRRLAKAHTWRMAIEAYRAYRVNGICPWTMFEDPAVRNFDLNPASNLLYQVQAAAYHPNAVFVEEYSPRFFVGQTATRHLRVFNDRMTEGNLSLRWRAADASWQSRFLPMQPAEARRERITFTVPSTPGPFGLDLVLSEGTNTLFSNHIEYVAMNPASLGVPTTTQLGLFDPHGTTAPLLARFNVPFRPVPDLRTAPYSQLNLLLIGRHALTNQPVLEVGRDTISARWQDFMLRGGWVLVLEQTNYPAWMPYELRIENVEASYAFPAADHPVTAGLTAEDLRWWADDHRVVTHALALPTRGNFRPLATVGSKRGVEYAAALEIPVGSGGLLCAQWLVTERFDSEPLAGVLLHRMLQYCSGQTGHLPLQPAAMVSDQGSLAAAKLSQLGLIAEDLSDRLTTLDPARHPVTIIAGGAATWQQAGAHVTRLLSYVQAGGQLLLHRPTEQFLSVAAATLCPLLEPVEATLGLVLRRDVAEAGVQLASHDLYWIEQAGTWNQAEVLSTNVARRYYRKRFTLPSYSVIQVENMPVKTTGSAASGGWWLYAAGYVAQNITVTQAGSYLFSVKARGTPLDNVWPIMSLRIDGGVQDSVSVSSTQLEFYTLAADLSAGVHELALSFDNDAYAPPQDRNLFLDELRWGRDTDSTTCTLTKPGVVAQVRHGSGRVVLDEVLWEEESRNSAKASRHISRLLMQLGATVRLPLGLQVEAETMTNINISVYSVSGGLVRVGSNGRIQTSIHFTTAGNYLFELWASGTPLTNVYPLVALQIDGVTRTNFYINSTSLSRFGITLPVTAGLHTVALNFFNDAYAPPEDRNVTYDRLVISPEVPPLGPPLINLIEPGPASVFPAQAAVSISADAACRDGYITQVTLLTNGVPLAMLNALPYAMIWTNPPPGYYTLAAVATDSRGLSATSAPVTISVLPPPVTLVPTGAVWRYLDDGTDQGSAWRDPGFDDSGWKSGQAKFGYGDTQRTIINIGPAGARYITTYFRHRFTLIQARAFTNLAFRVLRDDGVVVWLNGIELFRMNMTNSGLIGYLDRALASVTGADESTYFPTNVAAAALRDGLNVLAVELHQAGLTTSDAGFDLELVAQAAPPPPAPRLAIQRKGMTVELHWPAAPAVFVIESTTNLSPPIVWQPGAPTNPAADPQRFFRLRWP